MDGLSKRLERAIDLEGVTRAENILEKEDVAFESYVGETPNGDAAIWPSETFEIATFRSPPNKRGMIDNFRQLNDLVCTAATSGSTKKLHRVCHSSFTSWFS